MLGRIWTLFAALALGAFATPQSYAIAAAVQEWLVPPIREPQKRVR